MFANIRAFLHRPEVVEFQLLFALSCMYTCDAVRKNYQIHFANENRAGQAETKLKWKWRGFPSSLKYLMYIRAFYNLWQVYVIIRTVFSSYLEQMITLLFKPSIPARCYLVGRFTLEDSISVPTGLTYCCVFFAWSILQRFSLVTRPCSVVYFLLHDEGDIRMYIEAVAELKELHEEETESCGVAGQKKSALQQAKQTKSKWLRQQLGERKLLNFVMTNKVVRQRHASGNQLRLKLRPNRTVDARHKLLNWLIIYNMCCFFVILSIVIVLTTVITIWNVPDSRYIRDNPNCEPTIEKFYQDKPNDSWSPTVTPLRLFEGVCVGIENLIIWTEVGFISSFGLAYVLMIIYDLIIYWQYLHTKISKLTEHALLNLTISREFNFNGQHEEVGFHTDRFRFKLYPRCTSKERIHPVEDNQYNENISQLQSEIHDFFTLIRQADAHIGNILILYLVLWLLVFPMQSYHLKAAYGYNESMFFVFLFQFALLIIIFGISSYIWRLNRLCMKSHSKLRTLVAFDKSIYKKDFASIMDYFDDRKTCFTLLKRIPFKSTTLLTILGWSISADLILEGLIRR